MATVRDLIEMLQKLDPNQQIALSTSSTADPNHLIVDATVTATILKPSWEQYKILSVVKA